MRKRDIKKEYAERRREEVRSDMYKKVSDLIYKMVQELSAMEFPEHYSETHKRMAFALKRKFIKKLREIKP